MAYQFQTNQQISGNYTAHQNQTRFTLACWIRRPSTGTIQNLGFSDVNNNAIALTYYSDNAIYPAIQNNDNSYGFVNQSITGLIHCAMVFDGSQPNNQSRLILYINAQQQPLGFGGTVPTTTSSTTTTFRVGRAQGGNYWSSGVFAEIGMWQAALSANDVAALFKGMTPDKVIPDKLFSYIPLVREIQDVRAGISLTNTGATVADHPRVYA